MDDLPIQSTPFDTADHPPPSSTSAAEGLPRRRFTVAEVEAMVEAGIMLEDERVELIGGELVPMAAKGHQHEVVKVALNRRWSRAAPDDVEVAPETTLRLSVDTYLEPDFVLFDRTRGLTSLSGDSVYFVVEIAESSLSYDTGRKAALYASFGVRELWVIHAVPGATRIFRSPADGGYAEMLDIAADGKLTPLFAPSEFVLRLTDLGIF